MKTGSRLSGAFRAGRPSWGRHCSLAGGSALLLSFVGKMKDTESGEERLEPLCSEFSVIHFFLIEQFERCAV